VIAKWTPDVEIIGSDAYDLTGRLTAAAG